MHLPVYANKKLIHAGFFQGRPFIYVNESIDPNVVYQFMMTEWKLDPANIVVPVISDITDHKPFKNLKIVESLRDGIKNVRYLSIVEHIHILLLYLDDRRV
jgi:hypothetical protein